MARVKNTDGFSVHGWMVTELGLCGLELMAYAMVHQFSQSSAGIYTGGVPYLCDYYGSVGNTARKYFHSLEKKGLIEAIKGDVDGVPYIHYKVTESGEKRGRKAVKNTLQEMKGTLQNLKGGDPSKIEGGTLQNLKVDNKRDNNTPPAITNVIAAPPSKEEVAAYAREKGFLDPEGFAEHYIDVQTENGWVTGKGKDRKPVSNWKLNVLAWRPYHRDRVFRQDTPSSSPTTPVAPSAPSGKPGACVPPPGYKVLTDEELRDMLMR